MLFKVYLLLAVFVIANAEIKITFSSTDGSIEVGSPVEFDFNCRINTGGTSNVYLVQAKTKIGELYALKMTISAKEEIYMDNEWLAAQKLRHEDKLNGKILKLVGLGVAVGELKGKVILIEYIAGDTLFDTDYDDGTTNSIEILNYGLQMVEILEILGRNGMVHRDIKSDNIFCQKSVLKLFDFGFSKFLGSVLDESKVYGTQLFMGPDQQYGKEVMPDDDLWALECMMIIPYYKNVLPWDDEDDQVQKNKGDKKTLLQTILDKKKTFENNFTDPTKPWKDLTVALAAIQDHRQSTGVKTDYTNIKNAFQKALVAANKKYPDGAPSLNTDEE